MSNDTWDLFLSYDPGENKKNIDKVAKIYDRIKYELNLKICWDQDSDFKNNGIQNSTLFICLITRDYSKNESCMSELALASNLDKEILFYINENVDNMSHRDILNDVFNDAAFYLASHAYFKTEKELIDAIKLKLKLESPSKNVGESFELPKIEFDLNEIKSKLLGIFKEMFNDEGIQKTKKIISALSNVPQNYEQFEHLYQEKELMLKSLDNYNLQKNLQRDDLVDIINQLFFAVKLVFSQYVFRLSVDKQTNALYGSCCNEKLVTQRYRALSFHFHPDKNLKLNETYIKLSQEPIENFLSHFSSLINRVKNERLSRVFILNSVKSDEMAKHFMQCMFDLRNALLKNWHKLKILPKEGIENMSEDELKEKRYECAVKAFEIYQKLCENFDNYEDKNNELIEKKVTYRMNMARIMITIEQFIEAQLFASSALVLIAYNSKYFSDYDFSTALALLNSIKGFFDEKDLSEIIFKFDDEMMMKRITGTTSALLLASEGEFSASYHGKLNYNLTTENIILRAHKSLDIFDQCVKEPKTDLFELTKKEIQIAAQKFFKNEKKEFVELLGDVIHKNLRLVNGEEVIKKIQEIGFCDDAVVFLVLLLGEALIATDEALSEKAVEFYDAIIASHHSMQSKEGLSEMKLIAKLNTFIIRVMRNELALASDCCDNIDLDYSKEQFRFRQHAIEDFIQILMKKDQKSSEIKAIEYFDHKILQINDKVNLFKYLNQFDKVLECYEEKLDLVIKSNSENSIEVADVHEETALCYKIMGDYDKAIDELQKSIDIYALKKDDELESKKRELFLEIASCFYENLNLKQAAQCLHNALEHCRNEKEKRNVCKSIQECEEHMKSGNIFECSYLLISGSWDSSIKLWCWDPSERNIKGIHTIESEDEQVNFMAFLRKYLLVSGHSNNVIKLWDLYTKKCIQVLEQGHEGEVTSIVIFNKELFASASYDGKIILWEKVSQVDITQDLAEQFDAQSHKWDLNASFRKYGELDANVGSIYCLCAFKWNELASGCENGTIHLWRLRENALELMRSLEGHRDTVKCLMHLNKNFLASGGNDNTIRLWSLSDYSCSMVLNEHECNVNCLLSLRNGFFASGSKDESIRIWELNKERSVKKIEHSENRVMCLREVGNDVIASGDTFGNINLWSMHDYTLLHTFKAHNDTVSSLLVCFKET